MVNRMWRYFLLALAGLWGKTQKGGYTANPSIGGDIVHEHGSYGDNSSGGLYNLSQSDGLRSDNRDTLRTDTSAVKPLNSDSGGIRISTFISYREATKSETAIRFGIRNIPTPRQVDVMRNAGEKLFDPMRRHFGVPLYISSFFRSKELNEKIGGAYRSHHMILDDICAIDIDMDGKAGPTNVQIFNYIRTHCRFNTLIWEFGDEDSPAWVHVSYSTDESKNDQRKIYRAVKRDGKTVYETFKCG